MHLQADNSGMSQYLSDLLVFVVVINPFHYWVGVRLFLARNSALRLYLMQAIACIVEQAVSEQQMVIMSIVYNKFESE